MKDLRKKQKKLYSIMKAVAIFTAAFIFIFIGAKPYVDAYNSLLGIVVSYFCDIIVVISLAIIFVYYSKYGKIDYILSCAEDEINDAGYYISSRISSTVDDYVNEIYEDLKHSRFAITQNLKGNDFDFDLRAFKGKDYIYVASIENVDKNDILAYLDEAINDITVKSLKRKGNAVVCFVSDNVDDSAIELSKMITPIGRKNQLKIAIAIVDVNNKNVYFNGNKDTRCKALIANYIMNLEMPIKENYISREKLPYQIELENRLNRLTVKDFKSDNFYIH